MKTYQIQDGSITCDGYHATAVVGGKTIALDADVSRALSTGIMDANAAVFFQRQLEHIKARSYDRKYPELKARSLFPVSNEAGPGATSITYRTYDKTGVAKIIEAYAQDLPRADAGGKETTIPVRSIGISYGYNLDEIRSSQMVGASLDQRRADAARRAVEQVVNDVAFFGDESTGMMGLFDNPNIPNDPVVDPGTGTDWASKAPDEILFDINDMFADVFESTNMCEEPNTLLVPPAQWTYLMSTPRASNSDTTVGAFIAANSPFLSGTEAIIPVNECAALHNPVNATDCMVAYDRSPDKCQLEVPSELEFQPVQQRNLEFIIPGSSRLAGLNIYYPLAFAIRTGI